MKDFARQQALQSQVVFGEAGHWYVMHSGREINTGKYNLKPRKTKQKERDMKGGTAQPDPH